jgi:hypothetical protein
VRLEVDKAFLNVRVSRGEVEGDVQRKGGRVVDMGRGLGEDCANRTYEPAVWDDERTVGAYCTQCS